MYMHDKQHFANGITWRLRFSVGGYFFFFELAANWCELGTALSRLTGSDVYPHSQFGAVTAVKQRCLVGRWILHQYRRHIGKVETQCGGHCSMNKHLYNVYDSEPVSQVNDGHGVQQLMVQTSGSHELNYWGFKISLIKQGFGFFFFISKCGKIRAQQQQIIIFITNNLIQ